MNRTARIVLALALVLGATTASAQSIVDVVKTGTPDQVRALVANDAAVLNAKDPAGNTALHQAAIIGSVPMVEVLLSLGAAVDAVNTAGGTPLVEAIRARKPEAALVLIRKGADVKKADVNGEAPLHLAARWSLDTVIAPLVAKGADLEQAENNGLTPLMLAVFWADGTGVTRALLDSGANANARNPRGTSVLLQAAGIPDKGAANVELLLERGATYAPDQARGLMMAAVNAGAFPLFRRVVEKHGDSLFADARTNALAMKFGLLSGSVEIVQALLAKGIAIDKTPDVRGFTILHYVAMVTKAAPSIDLIIKNGLDVDVRTTDGRTAYNVAQGARNTDAQGRLVALGASREPQRFPVLTGPYLGQTPPAGDPVSFAPGIVLAGHGVLTTSPDGKEMYWSAPPRLDRLVGNPNVSIIVTTMRDGRWTAPAVASFSCPDESPCADSAPFVSPDNKRLFFSSTRPLKSGGQAGANLWFVERTPGGWSAAKPVGSEVNAVGVIGQCSVTKTGTLYFATRGADIYSSRFVNGAYTKPMSVGAAVNTGQQEDEAFVAPDESYLIFSRASDRLGGYFISYRLRNGEWSDPIALKLPRVDAGLVVTPDGKYVFLGGSTMSWAPATFIEKLRPKER